MYKLISRLCAGCFLITMLAAGTVVSPTVVFDDGFRISQANADISVLSRQFQSDTPSVIVFEADRAELSSEARRRLDIQANWIQKHPDVRFRVYGYSEKTGNVAYNMALSLRRAQVVVKYLTQKGIAPYRLEAMVSFGEDFPVSSGSDSESTGQQATTRVIGFSQRSATASAGGLVNTVPPGAATGDRRGT